MIFLFSSAAVISFSLFISTYFSRTLVEKEYASFQALSSSFLAQVENEIRVMDDVSVDIFYNTLVRERFTGFLEESENRVSNFSRMLDILVAINGPNFSLPIIALYSSEGEKIQMSTYSGVEYVNMSELDWTAAADRNRYKKVLTMPYQQKVKLPSQSVRPFYISLYRSLRDIDGDDMGYIETSQYAKKIFSSIITYQRRVDPNLKVYVFSREGDLIFPYNDETIGSDLQEFYFGSADAGGSTGEYVNPVTGSRELIYGETSFYTDWTYICSQDINRVLLPVRNASRILIYATIVLFFAVTIISLLLSRSITRPIRDLHRKFHSTSIETLSGDRKMIRSSYGELNDLNDAFHLMSEKLKKSMDDLIHSRQRETESRFLALQSQINPHFYYNSLSSIMVLTEENRNEEVLQYCDALSQFMRYSAHNQPGTVSLSTELEYAEKYLYCMKVRYQSSLNYSVHIDDDLRNLQIPKLIIQPLVENAAKYGTNCTPPWNIEISAFGNPEGWTISVKDSGPGFSEESLKEFGERTKDRDSAGIGRQEEENLGLINVYYRWKIFSGESFRFDIKSGRGGSTVTIGQKKKETTF